MEDCMVKVTAKGYRYVRRPDKDGESKEDPCIAERPLPFVRLRRYKDIRKKNATMRKKREKKLIRTLTAIQPSLETNGHISLLPGRADDL